MRLFVLLLLVTLPSSAIVWRGDVEEIESKQLGEMAQVGKVFYSPLKVFGGSCLAMGGKWVLTSRHGTDKWAPKFLEVEFPALGDERYVVDNVVYPESGDFALMRLTKEVKGAKPVKVFGGEVAKGQRVWLGGFGKSGPVGKVGRGGRFYSGSNRVDGMRGGKISISLSKATDDTVERDEAILAIFDSGSPMFVETKEGWRLAGVGSSASNRSDPGYGDRAGYAPLKNGVRWLTETMKKN